MPRTLYFRHLEVTLSSTEKCGNRPGCLFVAFNETQTVRMLRRSSRDRLCSMHLQVGTGVRSATRRQTLVTLRAAGGLPPIACGRRPPNSPENIARSWPRAWMEGRGHTTSYTRPLLVVCCRRVRYVIRQPVQANRDVGEY